MLKNLSLMQKKNQKIKNEWIKEDIIDHPDIPHSVYDVLFTPGYSKHITPRPLISDASVQNFLGSLEENRIINLVPK